MNELYKKVVSNLGNSGNQNHKLPIYSAYITLLRLPKQFVSLVTPVTGNPCVIAVTKLLPEVLTKQHRYRSRIMRVSIFVTEATEVTAKNRKEDRVSWLDGDEGELLRPLV